MQAGGDLCSVHLHTFLCVLVHVYETTPGLSLVEFGVCVGAYFTLLPAPADLGVLGSLSSPAMEPCKGVYSDTFLLSMTIGRKMVVLAAVIPTMVPPGCAIEASDLISP